MQRNGRIVWKSERERGKERKKKLGTEAGGPFWMNGL